jgi:hypothetical protein
MAVTLAVYPVNGKGNKGEPPDAEVLADAIPSDTQETCVPTSAVCVMEPFPQFTEAKAAEVASSGDGIKRNRAQGGSRMVAYSIQWRTSGCCVLKSAPSQSGRDNTSPKATGRTEIDPRCRLFQPYPNSVRHIRQAI